MALDIPAKFYTNVAKELTMRDTNILWLIPMSVEFTMQKLVEPLLALDSE